MTPSDKGAPRVCATRLKTFGAYLNIAGAFTHRRRWRVIPNTASLLECSAKVRQKFEMTKSLTITEGG